MFNKKSIFSWNIPAFFSGDPKSFSTGLIDAGFEAICLKVANGNLVFKMSTLGPWPKWGENVRPEMIEELRKAGLKIYLWHFLYGGDPKGEMDVASRQCARFQPDGYIWDAETTFDGKSNAVNNARLITKGLKVAHPNIPQALCWWALPRNPKNYNIEWHPIKVANAFIETVDTVMPMMYWGGSTATDAIAYLNSSLKIWRTITSLPIVPIGRAYTGDGGILDPHAIVAFADEVMALSESMNLPGISWWSLDKGIQNPACWVALKSTPKYGTIGTSLTYEEIIDRLVLAHSELFPELGK